MLSSLKKRLYFFVAAYFAFWARLVLRRWRPRIVVITGSSGKTTLLQMIEAQLGEKAIYSHHANSAIGIPFYILGLNPNILGRKQWLSHFVLAPFKAWRRLPATKLFIVEADCDRPHEGEFTAKLLKPEVTLWVSVYRTHVMNFDRLVRSGQFASAEEAIAWEFGNFLMTTQRLVVVNSDQPLIVEQLKRVPAGTTITKVSAEGMTQFKIGENVTTYQINGQTYRLPGLHPKDMAISLQLVAVLLDYLNESIDPNFAQLKMPPGRSNLLHGKNHTVLIDSTYNTGLEATRALLELFADYPAKTKWVVLGDILEQGSLEKEEHEGLAELVAKLKPQQAILLGPRTKKYTLPLLRELKIPVVSFDKPNEVLDFINGHLAGGEALLFKGGRFLEGVVEQLLADPSDAHKLVRREVVWVKRRQQWGLPR